MGEVAKGIKAYNPILAGQLTREGIDECSKNPEKSLILTQRTENIEVKEIKMRPGIDVHDYDVKMRAMNRFLDEGDKVKVTLRFRGREMAHQDLGMNVLNRVKDDLDKQAKVEQYPRMEGRQMVMVLVPR